MVENSDTLKIVFTGSFVAPLLKTKQTGKVLGVTSKGIYLLFGSHVLLLTTESIPNPFMIYLPSQADLPQNVKVGQTVELDDQILRVAEKTYDLTSISKIIPAALPRVAAKFSQRRSSTQVLLLFNALNLGRHSDSLIFIVDALLNHVEPGSEEQRKLLRATRLLRHGVQEKNLEEAESGMQSLVGNGKGLTPSGDDLINGFVLIQNCLISESKAEEAWILQFNARAIELAQTKTTWISANMIEASSRRLADERVGNAAQLMLGTRKMDGIQAAKELESFGHSSGIDTFTGMAAALLP